MWGRGASHNGRALGVGQVGVHEAVSGKALRDWGFARGLFPLNPEPLLTLNPYSAHAGMV